MLWKEKNIARDFVAGNEFHRGFGLWMTALGRR